MGWTLPSPREEIAMSTFLALSLALGLLGSWLGILVAMMGVWLKDNGAVKVGTIVFSAGWCMFSISLLLALQHLEGLL
jgi:hypothetical protein